MNPVIVLGGIPSADPVLVPPKPVPELPPDAGFKLGVLVVAAPLVLVMPDGLVILDPVPVLLVPGLVLIPEEPAVPGVVPNVLGVVPTGLNVVEVPAGAPLPTAPPVAGAGIGMLPVWELAGEVTGGATGVAVP